MKIIVGLGNPGSQYAGTRHNIGFMAIDKLADAFLIPINIKKHKAIYGSGMMGSEKVILVKPQTYMNLSGESVRALVDFYKVEPSDLIVIFDDISLAVGQLRIRKKGSAGGHNGIKSIISHLGTNEFARIKIGVGERIPGQDLADHVLSRFPKDQLPLVDEATNHAAEAAFIMLRDGIEVAMNQYNSKKSNEA